MQSLENQNLETISIVVLNYNGAHLLADCLESLQKQTYPALEILVVDNASIDNSREVAERYHGIRWLPLPTNAGLGPGYNHGIQHSRGSKVFVVNNDMCFMPDCVSELAKAFDQSDVFAADPVQRDGDGSRLIHGIQRVLKRWNFSFGIPFLAPYQDFNFQGITDTAWACAGAMMIDRDKFQKLGGFDPTFFLDYEDVDLCWRAWMRGWRTRFVPTAILNHKVGQSEDVKMQAQNKSLPGSRFTPINQRRQLSQCKNAGRFILKCMPRHYIAAAFLMDLAKCLTSLVTGKLRSAQIRATAMCKNFHEWQDIKKERRYIVQSQARSSTDVLNTLAGLS